jgi:hypothetical protein
MFRRNPRSRHRALMPGGLLRRPPLPPRVRRALSRANQLMADGQFVEAAIIFER